MANDDIVIKRLSGTVKTYRIKNRDSIRWRLASPVFFIAMPETSADQSEIIKIEGNSLSITIMTKLQGVNVVDEGDDISVGYKERDFLLKTFQSKSLDDEFQFNIDGESTSLYTGSVTDVDIGEDSGAPGVFTASIQFTVGKILTSTRVTD